MAAIGFEPTIEGGMAVANIFTGEWEALKKVYSGRCVICGGNEKKVGKLEQAHVKACSEGGSQVKPMCKNDHYKYDHGLLTADEEKGIWITAMEDLEKMMDEMRTRGRSKLTRKGKGKGMSLW